MDMRAFVEQDASDAAGDFGGDGGAATGSDIAARIQQSLSTSVFRSLCSRDSTEGF